MLPAGLEYLCKQAHRGGPDKQMHLLKVLAAYGDASVTTDLSPLLEHPHLGVRNHAAIALGDIGRHPGQDHYHTQAQSRLPAPRGRLARIPLICRKHISRS